MAQVTKYDLYNQVMIFFIANLIKPKHNFTPDDVSRFTLEAGLKIANFENEQDYTFAEYVHDVANYYGVDIKKAIQWMNKNPAIAQMFIDYVKQNLWIDHATFGDLANMFFNWVGDTVGSGVSALFSGIFKNIWPWVILGFGGYIVYKETQKRYR